MALELTEQELKDLWFTIIDYKATGFHIWLHAQKGVGDADGYFEYFQRQFPGCPMEHTFSLISSDGGNASTLISNIETLERFHELETVLNKN